MKQARLIKRRDVIEKETVKPEPQKQGSSIQASVEAVKGWIRDRKLSSQTQSRQVFASLFVQPQAE